MPGLFAGTPLERPVTCELCGRVLAECHCPRSASGKVLRPEDQPARVQRERRAGGKNVTVISGLDPAIAPDILKQLKSTCAAGGGITDGKIEIQGDHRDKIVQFLRTLGYPAKPAGG
jgi:translation initiation factor 1